MWSAKVATHRARKDRRCEHGRCGGRDRYLRFERPRPAVLLECPRPRCGAGIDPIPVGAGRRRCSLPLFPGKDHFGIAWPVPEKALRNPPAADSARRWRMLQHGRRTGAALKRRKRSSRPIRSRYPAPGQGRRARTSPVARQTGCWRWRFRRHRGPAGRLGPLSWSTRDTFPPMPLSLREVSGAVQGLAGRTAHRLCA